jgi:hypothetical protein
LKNPKETGVTNQVAAGLPKDLVTDWEMMFDGASRSLLLKFSTLELGMRIPRLFVRREGDERYVDLLDKAALPLANKNRGSTVAWGVQSPVLDLDGAVYFLLYEFRQVENRREGTAIAAVKINLLSDSVEMRDPRDCSPVACSLIRLLGTDRLGVYAKAGFSTRNDTGASAFDYFVVHLDWADWVVKQISPLPHIFY